MEQTKTRYQFLDVVRMLAALCVLLQHVLVIHPVVRHFYNTWFNPGIFGVTLFFLASGFIIPRSLEQNASLKTFWINRIFRIYPLFLFSLAVTLLYMFLRSPMHHLPPVKMIILQILFIQHFINGQSILTLYWTLSLEMLFYVMLSVIFYFGCIKKSTLLAVILLSISFITGTILLGYFHIGAGSGLMFYLATMFTSTLYYRYLNGEVKLQTLVIVICVAVLVFLSNSFMTMYGQDSKGWGGKGLIPVVGSTVLGYIVFSLLFYLRNLKFSAVFLYLGTISYSIYLVQGSVYGIIRPLSNPYLTDVVWISLTVIISAITYRFIEKPAMAFGHKLAAKK